MIHFTKDLYKFKKYRDLEKFIRKNEIDSIDNESEFRKIHDKGEDVYCCITPEMDSFEEPKNELMWKTDQHDLIDEAFLIMEEF